MNWKVDALCADILTDLMLQRSSWNQNAAHFIPSLQMVYSSHILKYAEPEITQMILSIPVNTWILIEM